MRNDFQLLDLSGLAKTYQQEYKQAYDIAIADALNVARVAYKRKLQRAIEQLSQYDSEAGSDGLEESAIEVVGEFDPQSVQISVSSIKEAVQTKVVFDWLQKNTISQKLSWFGPQMMAYFGTWKAIKVEDKYCPEATFKHNVVDAQDYFGLGSVLLAKSKRAEFFRDAPKGNQQYKSPINSLVPIVLAGFKRYQNIPYMEWDLTKLSAFENPDICSLVGCQMPELTSSEILGLRNTALTAKSGPRAGKADNPATSANLYHLTGTSIAHLPKLAKYIVLQTWCAHPQNRDKYAIVDLQNWDNVPEPLTGTDVFVQPLKTETKPTFAFSSKTDLPWD